MLDKATIPETYHALADRACGDKKSALKAAVRLFCIQCFGWSRADAATCTTDSCPLYAQNLRLWPRGVSDSAAGSPDLGSVEAQEP